MACPNECREDEFEGQELESHLRDQCPLTLVDCPFHYAGCQTQLPRKDMPEHMREAVTHLTLLVKESLELRQTTAELRQTTTELQQKELQHQDKQKAMYREIKALNEQIWQLQQTVVAREDKLCNSIAEDREPLQRMDQQHHDKLQANRAGESKFSKKKISYCGRE